MLQVQVTHRVGALALDLDLTTGAGLTAVIGPSGAGKTTLLRLIAGLVRPDRGRIASDQVVLVDTARRAWVPPHRRGVGYVAQDARLFPHLSVRNNLRYARWCAGGAPGGADDWDEIVHLLDLRSLLTRSHTGLSGGEVQRVALGRALLGRPRLLLLDEPLAAVDIGRRTEILPYLDRLREQRRLPMLYVTHAPAEIAGRADRVIRLQDGRVAMTSDSGGNLAEVRSAEI